ncbi:hypothetical protein WAI453_003046 [Rhynchosporium graminicola]
MFSSHNDPIGSCYVGFDRGQGKTCSDYTVSHNPTNVAGGTGCDGKLPSRRALNCFLINK